MIINRRPGVGSAANSDKGRTKDNQGWTGDNNVAGFDGVPDYGRGLQEQFSFATEPNARSKTGEDSAPLAGAGDSTASASATAVPQVLAQSNPLPAGGGGLSGSLPSGFDSDAKALRADVAQQDFGVTGKGIKIGIISTGFNLYNNDLQTAVADGALAPLNSGTYILQDGSTNTNAANFAGDDEGLAMAEIVHSIAPDAQIYFYTAEGGQSAMANAVTQLAANGCNIICDDFQYFMEPFYQENGLVSQAIDQAVTGIQQVTYLTAATNYGPKSFYESNFLSSNFQAFLPVASGGAQQKVSAFNFGTSKAPSAYENITIPGGLSGNTQITLEWNQPFSTDGVTQANPAYELNYILLDSNGNVVSKGVPDGLNDPAVNGSIADPAATSKYKLAVYVTLGNSIPVGQDQFKVIVEDDSNSTVVFNDPKAGIGSGTIAGHNMDPNAITVGAVDYNNTPAFGGTLANEAFSSSGPGKFLRGTDGSVITPLSAGKVDISAPDQNATTAPGFQPFGGTSSATPAAAAVAALMLQEDPSLTPGQIKLFLKQSAIKFGTSTVAGAGFIQADAAVNFAASKLATFLWTAASSGNWTDGAHWNKGSVYPGQNESTDNATINAASITPYTVTINSFDSIGINHLLLNNSQATLAEAGSLSLGAALTHSSAADFLLDAGKLDLSGKIIGGTLVANGATVLWQNGTLDGSTFDGVIDLHVANSRLHITDGLTVTGRNGKGAGLITVTGDNSALYFDGQQRFDNAEIALGGASTAYLWSTDPTNTGNTVTTLGSGVTLDQAGASVRIGTDSHAGDGFNLQGTLNAKLKGGSFFIDPEYFDNNGTMNVGSGDNLDIDSESFINNGTIAVDGANSSLTLEGTWANAGVIKLTNGGGVHFVGNLTDPTFGTIQNVSGTVFIDGVLNNSGTLDFGALNLGLVALTQGGVIHGGTLANTSTLSYRGGTLDGVTTHELLALSDPNSRLTIVNGITASVGTNFGVIDVAGSSSTLDFDGKQTIDNVSIFLGSSAAQTPHPHTETIMVTDFSNSGGPLVFGANAAIAQNGLSVTLDNATSGEAVVFDGTLHANYAGGIFVIDGKSFTNNGAIDVSNGDFLSISTNNPFLNDGTILVDGGRALIASAIDSSSTGSATITDGGTLFLAGPASPNVTFENTGGELGLEQPAAYSGEIDGVAANDIIDLEGIGLAKSATYSNHKITLLASNGSTLFTLNNVFGLADGNKLSVASDGFSGGTKVTVLNESVTWNAAVDGDFAVASNWTSQNGPMVPGSVDNAMITPTGTPYTVTSDADRSVFTVGTSASATLDIGKNTASTFTMLNGTGSGTRVNAGTIKIEDGSTLSTGGPINNTGQIQLDASSDSTRLVIAGKVTLGGTGTLNSTDSSHNFIDANGTAATLTNSSSIAGAEVFGDQNLHVINKGSIAATALGNALVIGGGTFTNIGMLEAKTGNLLIRTLVDQTSSTPATDAVTTHAVKADGSSLAGPGLVELDGGTIQSGNLLGNIETTSVGSTSTLVGTSADPLTIFNTVHVVDNTTLQLEGTIQNKGAIDLESTTDATTLLVAKDATLTGKGNIAFLNNGTNRIFALGSVTLTNNGNTISGAGAVFGNGGGTLTFKNLSGTVNAASGQLLLSPSHITNAGMLEATNSGLLHIANSTIANSSGKLVGTIGAMSAGSTVQLQGVAITGGKVKTVAGSTLDTNSQQSIIVNAAVSNAGTMTADNTNLTIFGNVANNGILEATSASPLAGLVQNNGLLCVSGAITGNGHALIDGTGEIEFQGTKIAENVTFADNAAGVLRLDHSLTYTGKIFGNLNSSDKMDLVDIAFGTGVQQAAVTGYSQTTVNGVTTGTVQIKYFVGSAAHIANFKFDGAPPAKRFQRSR